MRWCGVKQLPETCQAAISISTQVLQDLVANMHPKS
jgi:hypothetical protein